jgi:ABC-type glycerol-3-phosphate transport system substrate-binding protein
LKQQKLSALHHEAAIEAALVAALAGCLADTATEDTATLAMETETVEGGAPDPTETVYATPQMGTATMKETEIINSTEKNGAAPVELVEVESTDKDREVESVGTFFIEMGGKVLRRS